jgi:hypothetical protein
MIPSHSALARSWHVAVAIDEHRILVHGGLSSEEAGEQTLDDTWIFDTRRLAFTQVRGAGQARHRIQL